MAREKRNESREERGMLAEGISAMEELGLKRGSRKRRERKIPWVVLVEKREERFVPETRERSTTIAQLG